MENNNVTFHQKNVLLDIEGTTTSITFVKDVLFPYVREHLKEYLEQNKADEELQSVIDLLKKQNEEDKNNKLEGMVPILEGDPETDSIIRNVMWQMDNDRKTYSLKKLQGCIWRNGYSTGHLKSHLYEDVLSSLKCWKENGKNLFIYSSGSVEAQKLLFENTIYGNLLELFSGHFDTSVGSKTSSESYVNIAKAINCNCSDLLFITDTVKEAEAASEAGCGVIISVRPNNIPLSLEEMQKYVCIQSFEQLCPKL